MGSLGFSEMLIIFVVALLVFGPKKLPELGKSLGKGMREFRKATNELKSTWEEQVKDIENPLNDVKRDINAVGQDMKNDFYRSIDRPETAAPPSAATDTEPLPEALPAEAPPATASTDVPDQTESTTPKERV